MRSPTRAMVANLRWTRSGTVWADWILTGLPYGLRPLKDKHAVRFLHQALFRALPGESLLLGVQAGLDPAFIVTRMMEGVDLEHCPEWAVECEATLESLDQIGPGQRIFWLAVPLSNDRPSDRLSEPARAAYAGLQDMLGLPRAQVPAEEVERRLAQAARLAANIPGLFGPQPATPAQMVWLWQHSMSRGLFRETDLPPDSGGEEPAVKAGSSLGEPLLDEGGQSDLDPRSLARVNPLRRRYLKVADSTTVEEEAASYQALSVISNVPDSGMLFPGSEILGRVDEAGIDVDWAMRLSIRSSATVAALNQRALRNLNEQYSQRSGEVSHAWNMLDRVAGDLAEYVAILESDKLEVEAQATLVFAVGGPTAESAQEQAQALAGHFAAIGYKLAAPLGYQEELWWAMQPGVPASSAVREFAQITTSKALAATVPLASVRLGDTKGSVLGLNIGNGPLLAENVPCGPTSVVMHDLDGASDRQISGSLAVAGELGSGKTTVLMMLSGDVIDRGGHLVIADRTAKAEWAQWSCAVAQSVVVDVEDPVLSLDPLRIFDRSIGSRIMQTFLTPLLNVRPTSEQGVLLSDVLDPAYLDRHGLGSAGALLEHLQDGCELAGAPDLARLINVFARRDFGRVIFDGSIQPLDLTTQAVVILTHTLQLPSRDELEHKHLFEQMGLEKLFGRALNALIAALARHVCFADTSVLAGFVVSEAHAMTISPEGERELVDFVRDGRKHRAVLLIDSHDPEADFGSVTLRGLIPARILMRHRDKTLAKRGLAWLDLDPDDENLVEMVRTDTSPLGSDGVVVHRRGEGTMRDLNGNVGRVKVLLPARADRAAAIIAAGSASIRPGDDLFGGSQA
jgi:energy-coupling factor transporter ATP-binding protein EcfA2